MNKIALSCEECYKREKERLMKIYPNTSIVFGIVQFGDNEASERYIRNKVKDLENIGCKVYVYRYGENISQDEAEAKIQVIEQECDKMIIQCPIPKQLDFNKLLEYIPACKDIDGLKKNSPYVPCTARGIIEYLTANNFNFDGANVLVIGRSNLVGKPLAKLLEERNATVTLCHSHTRNIQQYYGLDIDLVIVAVGQMNFIDTLFQNAFWSKPIVIDVGINFDENGKMCGDVNYNEISPFCKYLTPVPKGVGLLTRIALLKNTIGENMEEV